MMASSETLRAWPKAKDALTEALKHIIETADQNANEDQAELQQLRTRSARVDDLQQENERLRSELETALQGLEKSKLDTRVIPASDDESSEAGSPPKKTNQPIKRSRPNKEIESMSRPFTPEIFRKAGSQDRLVQLNSEVLEEEFPDIVPSEWSDTRAAEKYNDLAPKYKELRRRYQVLCGEPQQIQENFNELEALQQKYNEQEVRSKDLQKNHEDVLRARKLLEDEVRKLKKRVDDWSIYTKKVDRKCKKLQAEVEACPHGHSKSRKTELSLNTGRGNQYQESDNETVQRPPSDIFSSPSKLITPLSTVFNPRFSRLRHSSPITGNSSTKLAEEGGRNVHHEMCTLQAEIADNQDPISSPPIQYAPSSIPPSSPLIQVFVPGSKNYRDDQDMVDFDPARLNLHEDQLPMHFDEDGQDLPRLDYGKETAETHETNHTSSTQGEPYPTQKPPTTDSPIVKAEGSSPVFLLERILKKSKTKRKNKDNIEESRIKYEELTDSPIGLANLDFGQSMDLDDHPHMATPRKKRPNPSASYQASRLDQLINQDETMTITPNELPASRAILVERSPDRPFKSRSPDRPSRNSTALQPLSSNKKLSRPDGQPPPKRRRKNVVAELSSHAFVSLSENGEDFENSIRELQGPKEPIVKPPLSDWLENPAPRNRLVSLEVIPRMSTSVQRHNRSPSTSNIVISRPSSSRAGSKQRDVLSTSHLSKLQTSPMTASPRNVSSTPKIASSGNIWDPPSSSPQTEPQPTISKISRSSKKRPLPQPLDNSGNHKTGPLRYRSIDSLKLDNFKVNPNYMPGYDYAFSEVVRNKNDRKCLAGCEKECCGPRFRKLAEMTIAARSPGQLSETARQADERALRNYMGDNYITYEKLSEEWKKETLIKAMARQFATDHGTHKHVFARRSSPSGFWNVDFPETQEQLANREKNRLEDRKIVEERYREAMRPGGQYVFRDE